MAVVAMLALFGIAAYPIGTRLFFGLLPPVASLTLLIIFAYRQKRLIQTIVLLLVAWLVAAWLLVQVAVEVERWRMLPPDVAVWGMISETGCEGGGTSIFRLRRSQPPLRREWRSTPIAQERQDGGAWHAPSCGGNLSWQRSIDELVHMPGQLYRVTSRRVVVLLSPERGIAAVVYSH